LFVDEAGLLPDCVAVVLQGTSNSMPSDCIVVVRFGFPKSFILFPEFAFIGKFCVFSRLGVDKF